MAPRRPRIPAEDLDGLRLLALSRIPRCGTCPRFRALVDAHDGGSRLRDNLPAVPDYCTHQVCTPLAARWTEPEPVEAAEDLPARLIRLQAC
jgi:hypothetical protein